ncbi:TPA: M48 family metalloprotease [Pseudomonas aeruginosa]|nr:M48 family metalloprotease [Pseudomonas aeruginosa]HBO9037976.1 M48 family metalloprotease [Pseudomonas aeruginosa]HBO9272494.1 M48 family metalloprotease [Pseudomonas aeruginosa]HBO9292573.1 M48 family metalloprotease [Pseudomonas aeruginosa]
MQDLLGATLILLAACSLAAVATAAFRVPALLGYLAVGALLGPSVSGVVAPGEALDFLSELGVALLLFMVGLEFSLGHFWLSRKTVLASGSLQMIAVATPLTLMLMWLGQPVQSAALLSTAAAMSSTALVSRQLADQGELTTRHGRSAIAVLVFQDLASVPLLALLAIWARGESPKIESVLLEVLGVLMLFAAAALASRRLLHGLLRRLSPRELAGVLAHEIAHIASEDLRVMGLADSVSRFTSLLALMGQIAILLSLPALLVGAAEVYWPSLLLLAASPQLALLAQLGLSRVREFDADRLAAELTGDPQGLASALAKIERVSRSWRAWLWPGWGNPEPSWLRTHPATQERISRLLTLAPGPASALPLHAPHFLPESALTPRPPRWRPSGLWR